MLLTRYSRPTLELDRRGRLVQVNFNNQVRSCQLPCQGEAGVSDVYYSYYSMLCSDVASTKQLYRALKLFNTVSSYRLCLMNYIYSVISTLSISVISTLSTPLYLHYLLRYINIIYLQISYSSSCLLSHRLQDGECVVFDNMRVLHGRSPFRWR